MHWNAVLPLLKIAGSGEHQPQFRFKLGSVFKQSAQSLNIEHAASAPFAAESRPDRATIAWIFTIRDEILVPPRRNTAAAGLEERTFLSEFLLLLYTAVFFTA